MPVHLVPRYARRIVPAVIVTAGLTSVLAGGSRRPGDGRHLFDRGGHHHRHPRAGVPGRSQLQRHQRPHRRRRGRGDRPSRRRTRRVRPATRRTPRPSPARTRRSLAPGAQTVAPGAYQVSAAASARRLPGSYQLCAWLAQNQNSTDQPVASPAMLSIAARGPQVSQLTVTVPKDLQPNVSFQVSYTTQTDQQLSLFSVMCPASEAAVPGQLRGSTRGRTRSRPPQWVLLAAGLRRSCHHHRDDQAEDRPLSSVHLGSRAPPAARSTTRPARRSPSAPGAPAPPSPKLKLTKATASHRHGVSIAGTTVSGFTGKLVVSAACGSATARRTTTARHRRFASSVRLPSGCRTAKQASSSPSHGQAPAPSPSRRWPRPSRSPGDVGVPDRRPGRHGARARRPCSMAPPGASALRMPPPATASERSLQMLQ